MYFTVYFIISSKIVSKVFLCSRKRHYIFQGCLLYKYPCKNNLEINYLVPLLQLMKKQEWLMENCHPVNDRGRAAIVDKAVRET